MRSKRHKNYKDCDCGMCGKDGESYSEWEATQYAEWGFIMHLVIDNDPQSPSGFNAHTHGMDLIGHFDFQITLPLKQEYISSFLHTMCSRVKKGEHFKHGDIITDLLADGYKARLIDAVECDRPVLRIVFADKNNCVMPDDMTPKEAIAQYGFSSRK